MSAIDMRGVVKRYRGADRAALDGLDLEVAEGTVCALLGRNGAGKTTAIRILSTLLRFDAGTAAVAGFDVRTAPADVRRSIGLIGQHAALDEKLGGRTNLRMIARLAGLDRAAAKRRSDELLDRFDLVDAADRIVGTYSGGMRRRLDLAAGLVTSPPVLMVDEPTTGLDPEARIIVWEAIAQLVAEGATILLTTQYLEEADRLADRIVMLRDGVAVADGTPDQLKARVGSGWVDLTFIGDAARDRAARLLDVRWSTVAPGGPVLRVVVPAPAEIAAVCAFLADHGLPPDDLSVGQPTLDDVFLHLHAGSPSAGSGSAAGSGLGSASVGSAGAGSAGALGVAGSIGGDR